MLDMLRPVFAGNTPVFVAELDESVEVLAGKGVEAYRLSDLSGEPPENVVLFVERDDAMRPKLAAKFAQSRVLAIPVGSFDTSPRTISYTFDILVRSDFERSITRNGTWAEVIRRRPSPLVFRRADHPEYALECHLLGDLKTSARTKLALEPGDFDSVLGYFEVETEVFDNEAHYFSLEGQLYVDGLLTARHATMKEELRHLHTGMIKTIEELGGKPGVLTVKDNRLISYVVDGEDLGPDILTATAEAYDRNMVEFSIGTNTPAVEIDWTINSLLNEGLGGIHVAIGDGRYGAHVDFVSLGAKLVM